MPGRARASHRDDRSGARQPTNIARLAAHGPTVFPSTHRATARRHTGREMRAMMNRLQSCPPTPPESSPTNRRAHAADDRSARRRSDPPKRRILPLYGRCLFVMDASIRGSVINDEHRLPGQDDRAVPYIRLDYSDATRIALAQTTVSAQYHHCCSFRDELRSEGSQTTPGYVDTK